MSAYGRSSSIGRTLIACWRRKWSARVSSTIASTMGTARGSTHGSWRPLAARVVSSPSLVTVFCSLAIVAVVLISRPAQATDVPPEGGEGGRRFGLGTELGLSLAAGASLATFQTTIGEIGDGAGVAPLLIVRAAAATLSLAALLVVWRRAGAPRPRAPRRSTLIPVVVSGFLLLLAHALLLEALSLGLLSIVGPITALSPAFTVIPAWLFLHEQISRVQVMGMVVATGGLVLVALG